MQTLRVITAAQIEPLPWQVFDIHHLVQCPPLYSKNEGSGESGLSKATRVANDSVYPEPKSS